MSGTLCFGSPLAHAENVGAADVVELPALPPSAVSAAQLNRALFTQLSVTAAPGVLVLSAQAIVRSPLAAPAEKAAAAAIVAAAAQPQLYLDRLEQQMPAGDSGSNERTRRALESLRSPQARRLAQSAIAAQEGGLAGLTRLFEDSLARSNDIDSIHFSGPGILVDPNQAPTRRKISRPLTKPVVREAAPDSSRSPFEAIVPKVSRAQLEAKLKDMKTGASARILLGFGGETETGTYAVGRKTPDGIAVSVEKDYKYPYDAAMGVTALRLARELHRNDLLINIDVIDVLSAAPNSTEVALPLIEGIDMSVVIKGSKSNPAYAEVVERYKEALRATAAALSAAGWGAILSAPNHLFVHTPSADGGPKKLAFQILPKNVVATPDGHFVLIDPF